MPSASSSNLLQVAGFEYGVLTAWLNVKIRNEDGQWPEKYHWSDAASDRTSLDGVASLIAAMNLLGSQGWELVGPPEVTAVVQTTTTPGRSDPNATFSVDYGEHAVRQFFFKRGLRMDAPA